MNPHRWHETMNQLEKKLRKEIDSLTEERDLLSEQKHYLSENINSYIEQIQEEKHRYIARVNIMCEEIDLLKHILSINNIQLTSEVVQDAKNHLRELTKEMIE